MRFMVEVQKDNQITKKLMTWSAVENFILAAVDAAEYLPAIQPTSTLPRVCRIRAGWQWDNGDYFEVSPFDVKAIATELPAVVEPVKATRRNFIYHLLTALVR